MKGLLSVSFGTSYEETRAKTIDVVDAKLAAEFPGRAFYTAWTSGRIVAKVRAERGEEHDTLEEAFARMSADGVDDLVVATMCLMRGHEMGKIHAAAQNWAREAEGRVVRVADPILMSEADRAAVARVLCEEFAGIPEQDALLFMGHGMHSALSVPGDASYNPNVVYGQMQDEFAAQGRTRFFVATVEGQPEFEDALAEIEACGATRVHLTPFMIVAGDHATNDLAGDDEDSWKSVLEARGYEVEVTLRGLGEYAGIHELVCDHARNAVA